MICYVVAETDQDESRAALTPTSAAGLVKLGLTVQAQPGLGAKAHYPDADYAEAGVELVA